MSFYTKDGLKKACSNIFGKSNVFDEKNYGNLRTAIQALTAMKKDDEYLYDDECDMSVIIGMCCKLDDFETIK